MGQEFYVALEKDVGVSCDYSPTILLNALDDPNLQQVASQHGFAALWSFFSTSLEDQAKFKEQYGLTPEEIEERKKVTPPERWCELEFNCPERWFEAAEGLKTVRCLLDIFRSQSIIPDAGNFVEALEITKQVLIAADKQGVRFHFAAVTP